MSENDSLRHKPPDSTKDDRADYFREITEFARSEITWVRSAYKYAISLVAIVATAGIVFTYKSTSDFKRETKEDVEQQIKQIKLRIDEDFEQQIKQMGEEFRLRIEVEFKKENIHNLVEEQAKTRIDEIADTLIEKQISVKVAPRIHSAEERLNNIQGTLGNATDEINLLSVLSEFTVTIIKAQNNDRKSFDKVRVWASDKDFKLSQAARGVWEKILDEHASPIFLSGFTVPWLPGVVPEKLSFSDLNAAFKSAPSPIRMALLEYIWQKVNVSKNQKMNFLADVIAHDDNLSVIEYAGRHFIEESKQSLKPLAIDEHLDWWEKNKDNYRIRNN